MKPTKKGIQPAPLTDSGFASTTPYGLQLPLDSCQDPSKCVDTVDTDCVIYTGPDISCQATTIINTDDSLTTALQSVVDYFCINGGGGGIGAQGVQGVQGTRGTQGIIGTTGAQGITGAGVQGAEGIQGRTGAQGLRGTQGAFGPQGTTGSAGLNGTQGTQGVQGLKGIQGPSGFGAQGTTGANGSNGSQGATGTSGSTGAQGATGASIEYVREHAYVAGDPAFDYNGRALLGTPTSSTGWTIYRVVISPSGTSFLQSATVNPNGIWDNYSSYSYL